MSEPGSVIIGPHLSRKNLQILAFIDSAGFQVDCLADKGESQLGQVNIVADPHLWPLPETESKALSMARLLSSRRRTANR